LPPKKDNKEQKTDFKSFQADIKKAVDWITDAKETILNVSHIDADGLTSAGIIGRALHREEIPYHIRSVRQLEKPIIGELAAKTDFKTIIFSDLGAGQLESINEFLSDRQIIILDHHPFVTEPTSETILNINPDNYGYDGANQISGSGISYFFAKALNPINIDSSALAIVGALGDRQDKGKKSALTSLNHKIVEDGIKAQVLEEKMDIRLFGRETRPIHLAIQYTTDPFLPGLTGNGDMCNRFMRDTGIPQQKGDSWRTIQELSKEERMTLVDSLITWGLSRGMSSKEAENILGQVYVLTNEKPGTPLRDAREFGSMLNSCGRLGANGVAIGICMGERNFLLKEAEEKMAEYRKKISEYLQIVNVDSEFLKEFSNFILVDGREVIDDSMIGTVISIAISNKEFIEKNKPMMGIANSEDGTVKISMRGTGFLVQQGLDLGTALREAQEEIGDEAEAGGHNIAAGARIPQGTEQVLIEKMNDVLENQLTKITQSKKPEKELIEKKEEDGKVKQKGKKKEKEKEKTKQNKNAKLFPSEKEK
jgi:RecJ-like exonuclease